MLCQINRTHFILSFFDVFFFYKRAPEKDCKNLRFLPVPKLCRELVVGIQIFYDAGDIIEERFRKRRDRFAEMQSGFLMQHIPTTGDDNEIDGKRAVVDATLELFLYGDVLRCSNRCIPY